MAWVSGADSSSRSGWHDRGQYADRKMSFLQDSEFSRSCLSTRWRISSPACILWVSITPKNPKAAFTTMGQIAFLLGMPFPLVGASCINGASPSLSPVLLYWWRTEDAPTGLYLTALLRITALTAESSPTIRMSLSIKTWMLAHLGLWSSIIQEEWRTSCRKIANLSSSILTIRNPIHSLLCTTSASTCLPWRHRLRTYHTSIRLWCRASEITAFGIRNLSTRQRPMWLLKWRPTSSQ